MRASCYSFLRVGMQLRYQTVVRTIVVLSLFQPAFLFVIKSGDDLVNELCKTEIRKDAIMTLKDSFNYTISGNQSCVVNIHMLEIKSEDNITVDVSCENPGFVSFAFIDVTVLISNVNFSGCGAFLSRFNMNLLSSTSLRFLETHSGFFVFLNCSVKFFKVGICHYFGFAIVGINMRQSEFIHLSVTQNDFGTLFEVDTQHMIGSGMLLMFTNSIHSHSSHQVTIANSKFYANYEFISLDGKGCVTSHFYTLLKPFVINAAALTVIFNVESSMIQQPSVSIQTSLFNHNSGSYCSGLLIVMINSTGGQVRISKNTKFENNGNVFKCQGTALVFYAAGTRHAIAPLIVNETNFSKHKGIISGDDINSERKKTGTVFIAIHHSRAQYAFLFERVSFSKNVADTLGTCLSVVVYDDGASTKDVQVNITLRSIVAKENVFALKNIVVSGGGSFTFNNVDNVVVEGSASYPSKFCGNQGSVIQAHNTPISLRGVVKFHGNKAVQGAILLLHDSLLYFNDGLNLEVDKNSADTVGGAIHSVSLSSYTFDLPNCALQISENVTCTFTDNKAVFGGSSIFAFPIYSCYDIKTAKIVNSSFYYANLFSFSKTHNSTLNEISTKAHHVVICKYTPCNPFAVAKRKNYFPGQKISLCVCAFDSENNSCVYSVVRVSLTLLKSNKYKTSNSAILDSEKLQYATESDNFSCSIVNVTVSYHDCCKDKLQVVLSSDYHVTFFQLDISEEVCPSGFGFDESGVCVCGTATKQFYSAVYFSDDRECDINLLTFKRPNYIASPWLGYFHIEGKKLFGITDLCPFDICSTDFSMTEFKYDVKSDSFLLSDGFKDLNICREHREGVLCGNCSDGYSVVFGSGECKRCSNWWLWTIVLYAATGPFLIYILYALNLTLTTGTINGIVFYSQAANVGILPFVNYFPDSYLYMKFVYIFLSFLNFNLGFSVCFYDGMTEIEKTGLTLIFPIYLLAIIIFIIVISRYSTWLSNKTSATSVQVLVTVVHISVSKLSVTIIEVFTPTTIYTGDNHVRKVWLRNGNVEFFNSSDKSMIVLMVFTIATVSFVLFPYFFLLIGGRCLLRHAVFNHYCRAVYEAIHGPYKENRKFWFLARQILLIVMFIIYSIFRGTAIHLVVILTLCLLILFSVLQEYLKPFKNKVIGTLDLSIMLNLNAVYLVAWFQSSGTTAPNLSFLVILICILVSIVFVTFLFVLVYHMLLIWRSYNRSSFRKTDRNINEESALLMSNTSQMSFYSSCNKYREPVISFN